VSKDQQIANFSPPESFDADVRPVLDRLGIQPTDQGLMSVDWYGLAFKSAGQAAMFRLAYLGPTIAITDTFG
jgi:hypothetical protein